MSLFPPDDWVTVEQTPIEPIAHMILGRLESEGVRAKLRGNKIAGSVGAISELNISWSNPLGGIEVRVHPDDAALAREILAEIPDEDASETETEAETETDAQTAPQKRAGATIFRWILGLTLAGNLLVPLAFFNLPLAILAGATLAFFALFIWRKSPFSR